MKKFFTFYLLLWMGIHVSASDSKFYLFPGADWMAADATFGAVFKDGANAEQSVMFSLSDSEENLYELTVPDGDWTEISMRRYGPDGESSQWGGFYDEENEVYVFIPYDGTYNCISIRGWANGIDPAQYTTSVYSGPASITIRIKKPEGWNVIRIHAWNDEGVIFPESWPGRIMEEDAEAPGWYIYTFEPSVKIVSFNFNDFENGGFSNELYNDQTMTNRMESTAYNEDGSIYDVTVSLSQAQNNKPLVRAERNSIIASFNETVTIHLFSISGKLLYAGTATHEFRYPVQPGIYLLRINKDTCKILVP
ncbi:MAG: starch-binding protein [Candidatus Azobacteroides sp.]|nr:starch-binding protein [Candidatus Azobacteroides sp.]